MGVKEMQVLEHEKHIVEYEKTIASFKAQNKNSPISSDAEIAKLEKKLEALKQSVYANLTPWQRIAICRHHARPKSIDFIKNITTDFVEISGDRQFRNDNAVICGMAKIDDVKFMVVAQEKGNDTESRIQRNFGMLHPEGYRKALRCMRLAEKFHLPILSFLDTPGAFPGLSAEERGQGGAIAQNLLEMSRLKTPIFVLLIGEGCSGGALGMGVGDVIGMLEHAYYSVISPEGCASILWKDSSKNAQAAATLKMHAEGLLEMGIIDAIIEEPLGGAHYNPTFVYAGVKKFILEQWNLFKSVSSEVLLEQRYQKFRVMGKFSLEDNPSVE
jgi:acetyl-CoA carboxylase carboxyl transferase subunit alpha